MSQNKLVVTKSEARILLALSNRNGATLSELAVATQLTLSDVQAIVSDLTQKNLTRFDRENQNVQLIEDGRRVSSDLARQSSVKSIRAREHQPVVIVPDGITSSKSFSVDDLDDAINNEPKK